MSTWCCHRDHGWAFLRLPQTNDGIVLGGLALELVAACADSATYAGKVGRIFELGGRGLGGLALLPAALELGVFKPSATPTMRIESIGVTAHSARCEECEP